MKAIKKLIMAIYFLMAVSMAYGQIQFGVTAGIGGATQSDFGNIYDNDDLYTSFNAGITTRKSFNETFAIKTNFLYTSKGRSFDVLKDGEPQKQKDKYSYLMLPVKAEYSIPVFNNRLFAAAGPYAGLLLDANQKIDGISTEIDDTKDIDFGLAFELGYSKLLKNSELLFSISYDMGLSKIIDNEDDLRNKALCVNAGLFF
ncbi:porin family protein [Maribellus comscasis]|nr:porin family protein [Maribellus comscasis]